MSTDSVDAVVEAKVSPEQRPIVAAVRDLMRQHAPQAEETVVYGSPAWKGTKLLAIISISKTHVTLAFDRGAEFTDSHGLLEGVGKRTRHVKLKSVDDVANPALADYVGQALALDGA